MIEAVQEMHRKRAELEAELEELAVKKAKMTVREAIFLTVPLCSRVRSVRLVSTRKMPKA